MWLGEKHSHLPLDAALMESRGTCGRLVPGEGTPPPPFVSSHLEHVRVLTKRCSKYTFFFF